MDNLMSTYTIDKGQLPPGVGTSMNMGDDEQAEYHIVHMPTISGNGELDTQKLPPLDHQQTVTKKSERRSSKRMKKHKKDKEVVQPHIVSQDSDVSASTYVLLPENTSLHTYESLPDGELEGETSISEPVVHSPTENPTTAVRRRNSAKPQGVLDEADEPTRLKFTRFGKKKKRKKKEEDLGVDLAAEQVREYVQAKFHQKVPKEKDEVDYRFSKQLGAPQPGIGGSRASLRSHTDYSVVKTRAFGWINFSKDAKSSYEPPFVCVSNTDKKDDLLQFMLMQWQLPEPKLIVSIVGGAKRFQFAKSRVSALFKQGLLDIATTTGAWILTPGSNTGVYKMVGSAVKDHLDATGSTSMNNIVLLGIASWGAVSGRERLEDESGQGLFPAIYPTAEVVGYPGTHPLEPNHSHFILVDDGSRDKFGGEIKWRAEFEKTLTEHVLSGMETVEGESDEVHIPLVTLLVNGGEASLESCSESLSVKIPLVAIAGSGRAAEVIVLLHQLFQNKPPHYKPTRDQLIGVYEAAMGVSPSKKVIASLRIIADHYKYISVFDFIHSGTNFDDIGLDRAILSALHHNDDNMDISKMKAQMRLALSWGRQDYARDEILNVNNTNYHAFMREKTFLHEVAVEALVEDMPVFVELLIENGFSLREFVTEECLELLYKKSMQREDGYSRFVRTLSGTMEHSKKKGRLCCTNVVGAEKAAYYMYQIGRVFKSLLGYTYPNIYKKDEYGNSLSCSEGKVGYRDPAQHLFLWATLFNRMDIARTFWKLSQDHIAGAIVGASVMRGLSRLSDHQEGIDITASFLDNSLKFETLANGILECCWSKDRQYTSDMLVREAPNWGNTTVLSMAYHGEMEEFLAQPACYTKLNKIWRGDIALRTNSFWIVLYALNPLCSFMLKFVRKRDDDPRKDERQDDPVVIQDLTTDDAGDRSPVIYKPLITVSLLGREEHEIGYFNAIYRAFRSPLVKCIHYSILSIIFLCIYALFLMTELRPYAVPSASGNQTAACENCCGDLNIGCFEISTYFWALTSLLEEIRQVWFRDTRSMKYAKQKLKDWVTDFWNKVDLISYCLFSLAIILRFNLNEQYFEWARWCYSFSFMVYFVRFSQVFYVVEQLGPKIIMIRKMFTDLLFFIIILSITIVSFGVITQAILHPESAVEWELINSILRKPYFQMYGELFHEEYIGYRWILLGFYMILTNILLLNLLIAMFSYTFEQVQEKSEILWKFNYYAVVHEHFDRPIVPFIGTLYTMLRHCGCSKESALCGEDRGSDFRRPLDDELNSKITKFVKVCMQKFVAQECKLLKEDMAHKVTNTAHRLETVIDQLDDLRDDVINQQASKRLYRPPGADASADNSKTPMSTHSLEKKIKSLETALETKFDKVKAIETKLDRLTDLFLHSQQP